MDIAEVSTGEMAMLASSLAAKKNLSDVGVKMLDNALDTQAIQGASLVKMIDAAAMERSVNPHIGGHFDMSV